MASTRAYHATGTGIDPQRGNVWNRSPTSAGVDFVCHLNSDATSFGWDVKPRSIVKRGEVNRVLMYSAI